MKRGLILLMVFVVTCIFAETIQISENENYEKLTIVSDNYQQYSLRIGEIDVNNEENEGKEYSYIHFNEWTKTETIGAPRLPKKSFRVAVPIDGDLDVSYNILNKTEIEISNPYPAQQAHFDGKFEYDVQEFTIDKNYYTKLTYPSNVIEISEPFSVRGVKMQMIDLYPFAYDGSMGKLTIFNELELNINISGSQFYDSRLMTEFYKPVIASAVINNNWIKDIESRDRTTGADMIVFSMYEFEDITEEFTAWKNQLGISTEIVYVDEMDVPLDEMFNFIEYGYDHWDLPPSFLTFIGDTELIPCFEIQSIFYDNELVGTDRIFACMDGQNDYHPDIAYGRISVDNNAEAEVVINKIINYEKNPISDLTFYESAQVCGYFQDELNQYDEEVADGWEDRRFVNTCEDVRDFLMTKNKDVDRVYVTPGSVSPTHYSNYYSNGSAIPDELLRANGFQWNGSASDITANINSGNFMILHRDHGISQNYTYDSGAHPSFSGWGDPYFSNSHVNYLTNGDKLPFVFSINCQTGWYDSEIDHDDSRDFESFSEMFLRKENGGAVGVYGASRNSLSGYNDFLIHGVFDAMWDDFLISEDYSSEGHMGMVLQQGLLAMEDLWQMNDSSRYEYDIFNVFGDPSLRVWRNNPLEITAVIPTSLSIEATQLAVQTNISNGMATITLGNEIIGETEFNSSSFNIPITNQLIQPDDCIVTISNRDHKPFTQTLIVTPPSGAYNVISDYVITDSNGNNDNEWDAGEELSINLVVKNIGNEVSNNGTILLQSNAYVNLAETSYSYSSLDVNSTESIEIIATLSTELENNSNTVIIAEVHLGELVYSSEIEIPVTKIAKYEVNDSAQAFTVASGTETGTIGFQNLSAVDIPFKLKSSTNPAYDLQGDDNYLVLENQDVLVDADSYTIQFWLNNPQISSSGVVFTYGEGNMIAKMSNAGLFFFTYQDLDNVTKYKAIPIPSLIENEWKHFAFVYTSESLTIYINGEMLRVYEEDLRFLTGGENLYIGADNTGSFEFDGYIDEFSIIKEGFTESEISASYNKMLSLYNEEYYWDFGNSISNLAGNTLTAIGDTAFNELGAPVQSWLEFENQEGVFIANENNDITFSVNSLNIPSDIYNANIIIDFEDEILEDVIIPVSLDYTLTSIDSANELISGFKVYPNPVRNSSVVNYRISLTRDDNIEELAIYNLRGQKIKSLDFKNVSSKNSQLKWDLRDNSGNKVPSGIYFTRLKTKESAVTKKTMIIK